MLPEAQTKNTTRKLASHFWRLSLGNLYTLVKTMFARDTSKGTGSRARGEGRERGNLPGTTSKPRVAKGAGGISVIDKCSSIVGFLLFNFGTAGLKRVAPGLK